MKVKLPLAFLFPISFTLQLNKLPDKLFKETQDNHGKLTKLFSKIKPFSIPGHIPMKEQT
jgi:hypothetical protein